MKITKLLVTLALSTVTLSQLSLAANAKGSETPKLIVEEEGEMSFSDVSPNHWAYKSIKELSQEYNILGGFPDGTFRGNRNITRYEAAAMIAQLVRKFDEVAAKSGKGGTVNKAALDKLRKEFKSELEDLQSEVKKLAKDQQDLQKDLDETQDKIDMVKDMIPKVKWMGEAAVRQEMMTNELGLDASKFLTNSPQMRLRLGVTGESNGGFNFGARLTTSLAGDNTNQFTALGNLNSRFGVNLDKAYVSFAPWDGALDLTLGRHGNPFMYTTQLVWDEDLTFDGSFLKLKFGDMDNNLSLVGGYDVFALGQYNAANPRSGKHTFKDDADGAAGAASGGLSFMVGGDTVKFGLGVNYHNLTNVNNLIGKSLSLNPRTNLLTKAGKHVSNFQLATGSLMFSLFPNAYFPVTIHADASYNLGAGTNSAVVTADDAAVVTAAKAQNLGLIAGLKLGKLKEAGNFMLGYSYKMVGTESVYSAFNEDQLGGSNIMAHEGKLGIQFAPMTTFHVTAQMSNALVVPTGATKGKDLWTIRTTLSQKF